MAKITELVKTYRLLSDPNAPDWNVKFVGGIVVAFVIIAASTAVLWNANRDEGTFAPAAATAEEGDARSCTQEELAAEAARTGAAVPKGRELPSGCTAS